MLLEFKLKRTKTGVRTYLNKNQIEYGANEDTYL